jgi:hypothetical protein
VFGAALPGSFYRRNESLPSDMRYFDGRPPETLRFGSPWPEGNFTWITKTIEVAPGFHLILLNGTWGVDLEVKEISLAIDTPDGIVLVVGCSHSTIEKIVEAAKNTINKPIHLFLGGTSFIARERRPDQQHSCLPARQLERALCRSRSLHWRARLRHSERDLQRSLHLCWPGHYCVIGIEGHGESGGWTAQQNGDGRKRHTQLPRSDDARSLARFTRGRQAAGTSAAMTLRSLPEG